MAMPLAGCSKPPPAASTNLRLTPEESIRKSTYRPEDRRKARQALHEVAADHRPVNPPVPAPLGMRFSDIERAVARACDDVEAAVVWTEPDEDGAGFVFSLRTVEDWPGEIAVRRVAGPEVYTAEAWFGRFPEEEKNLTRAKALRAALGKQMRAWGKKRAFVDE